MCMKTFLWRVLILNIVLLLTTALTVLLGSQQPTQLGILHLSDCALPCWIGIMPGKSTITEAKVRMREVYGTSAKYTVTEGNSWVEIRDATTYALQLRAVFSSSKVHSASEDI